MSERKGSISVKTADIFPIIKKWLYSEHDIFLRELVANATDAITKRSTLARTQNIEIPEGKIIIDVDKKNGIIKIHDNGIGMTEEEVEKYIAQLAFSGAEEFVKQMKGVEDANKFDIIGKFGLGFYSSFMVAQKVEIDSLSASENATATKWICDGDTEYVFGTSDRQSIGTTITLHVNDDGKEYLDDYKVNSSLRKFCDFMPYPITVYDLEKIEKEKKDNTKKKEEEKYSYYEKGTLINETTPLWKKNTNDLKDEDYLEFFKKLYPMEKEPLFWIHLKVDHPFTLEGILYFPKLNLNKPFNESNIKLYCKQVFVSDNVKNIIPEFLSLLKGVIDSPDIPLNVSRSSLQGDPNIKKISNYVIKKVAESLKKLFKNDRPKYEKIWEDIGIFVKYGCISDSKFDELLREMVIFKAFDNKYLTINEYIDSIPEKYEDKLKEKILYAIKDKCDNSLRAQLWDEQINSVLTDEHIDPHFMQHAEMKSLKDQKIHFCSVDSEIENILTAESNGPDDLKIKDLFIDILAPKKETSTEKVDAANMPVEEINNSLNIEIVKLKNSQSPAFFKIDEQMKRYRNMIQAMGQNDNVFPVKKTLVINPNNPLVKNTLKIWENGNNKNLVEKLCHHVEDLASISSEGLKDSEKEGFVKRSQDLISELSNHLI
ncbi:MAG: hypothetical protein A2202_01160 [Bdellovibrionales bacterium RIFOXYA1_FULL_36_14]|nr:MAG: hypothetical protein A2202_01160 [Bdellovibrionales bacterium RIFOXYA1_FULL_36_14]